MNRQRVAVVSGSTKGIGRAIAEKLVAQNFRVIGSARNTITDTNGIEYFYGDLSTKSGIKEFLNFIKERTDVVDVLVNNVGVFIPGSLMDEEEGVFEQQINTNLASTYHLTRGCIQHIRKSDKGYIFNICSTASIVPYPNGGSYCISKYAQLGFTKVLRQELKTENIKVSAVLPGATLTDSWSGTELPKDRFSDPNSIAEMIWVAYNLPDTTVMEEILLRPMAGDIT
jgi:short-subunit dehydrogenase